MPIDLDAEHDAARITVGGRRRCCTPASGATGSRFRFDVPGRSRSCAACVASTCERSRPASSSTCRRSTSTPVASGASHLDAAKIMRGPRGARRALLHPGDRRRHQGARSGRVRRRGVRGADRYAARRARRACSTRCSTIIATASCSSTCRPSTSRATRCGATPTPRTPPTRPTAILRGPVRELYERHGRVLGHGPRAHPRDATLIVMSDHGFAPYYKKVHLNTWLYQNGYLALVRADEIGQHPLFNNVFWRRTRAYAAGLNGLYLNVAGREAKGIVRAGAEYDALLDEISREAARVSRPRDTASRSSPRCIAHATSTTAIRRERTRPDRRVQSRVPVQRRFGARDGYEPRDLPISASGRATIAWTTAGCRVCCWPTAAGARRSVADRPARHDPDAVRRGRRTP